MILEINKLDIIDHDPGPIGYSDTSGYLTVTCVFTAEWNGYTKTIRFVEMKTGVVHTEVLVNDAVTEDMELVLEEGTWDISISGLKGESLIMSNCIFKYVDAPISFGGVPISEYMDRIDNRIYDNVASMVADKSIKTSVCETLGFTAKNDGGGAKYNITTGLTADGISIFALANGKFAQLIVDAGKTYDLRCFGCFPNSGVSESVRITAAVLKASTAKAILSQTSGTYLIGSRLTLKPIEIIGNLFAPPEWSIMNTFSSFNTDDDIVAFSGSNLATDIVILRNIKITLAAEANSAFSTFNTECELMKLKYAEKIVMDNVIMTVTNAGYSVDATLLDIRQSNNIIINNSNFRNMSGHLSGGDLWIRCSDPVTGINNIDITNNYFEQDGNDEMVAIWSVTVGGATLSNLNFKHNKMVYNSTTRNKTLMFSILNFSNIKDILLDDVSFDTNYNIEQAIDLVAGTYSNVVLSKLRVANSSTGVINASVNASCIDSYITSEAVALKNVIKIINSDFIYAGTANNCFISCKGTHVIVDNCTFNGTVDEGLVNVWLMTGATYIHSIVEFIKCHGTIVGKLSTVLQGHCRIIIKDCVFSMVLTAYLGSNGKILDLVIEDSTIICSAWSPFLQEAGGYITGTVSIRVQRNYISGDFVNAYGTVNVLNTMIFTDNTIPNKSKTAFGTWTASTLLSKTRNLYSDTIAVAE